MNEIEKKYRIQQINNEYMSLINAEKIKYNNLIKMFPKYARALTNQLLANVNELVKKRNEKISVINNLPSKNVKKVALLIGINYEGTDYALYGCINDAYNYQQLLKEKYGYTDFIMLTDKTAIKPTRNNILQQVKQVLINSTYGDSIFIAYSGHGTWTYDYNGDETDRRDEVIVPLDFDCIVDDELNALFTNYSKEGVNVYCIFDSCFSGTLLDLKYLFNISNGKSMPIINNSNVNRAIKSNVITISGCKDDQTSVDAYIADTKTFAGALTLAFIETVNNCPNTKTITFCNLIDTIRTELTNSGFTQIPQICSNMIDCPAKMVLL